MRFDIGTRMAYTEEVGQARYELYRGANVQLKKCLEQGFWIEAIALCESMLSDRIEARISFLGDHEEAARRHKTLGSLVRRIRSEDEQVYEELHRIYKQIALWNSQRNRAIHHAVKISDGEAFETWGERYGELEGTARSGADLVRKLSNELRKIKNANLKKGMR